MRSEKLITEDKAITNHRLTRQHLMENGGTQEEWDKMLDAQIERQIHNWPKSTMSPRWAGLANQDDFLVTPNKAWENMRSKLNREIKHEPTR